MFHKIGSMPTGISRNDFVKRNVLLPGCPGLNEIEATLILCTFTASRLSQIKTIKGAGIPRCTNGNSRPKLEVYTVCQIKTIKGAGIPRFKNGNS